MKRRKILICVDDEKIILDSLYHQIKKELDQEGYTIELAESGEEALEIYGDDPNNVAIIISDQIMPKMKGDELLTKIKGASPEVHTILLTGQASKSDIANAINNAGLFSFIEKPWDENNLILTIKKAIQSHRKTEQIKEQHLQLNELNETLEERIKLRTQEITDGINYAKLIQDGILPNEVDVSSFSSFFIYQKPLHIVSGDFFWYQKMDDLVFMGVIDCTGHGVPGAFMSIVGSLMLDKIVSDSRIYEPNLILNQLHNEIVSVLKQKDSKLQDGMDMSLVCVDTKSGIVKFSGARNHLIHIHNNEMTVLKGDNSSIGGQTNLDRNYTQKEFIAKKGTMIYMFSDGYADQFGGEKGKKFMSKKLKELLFEIHSRTSSDQKEIIESTLIKWMGDHDQVDDIAVMGIEF